jgi:hypothetical protein
MWLLSILNRSSVEDESPGERERDEKDERLSLEERLYGNGVVV